MMDCQFFPTRSSGALHSSTGNDDASVQIMRPLPPVTTPTRAARSAASVGWRQRHHVAKRDAGSGAVPGWPELPPGCRWLRRRATHLGGGSEAAHRILPRMARFLDEQETRERQRQRDRETERQKDREAKRQRKQRHRKTERQRERQRQRERETERRWGRERSVGPAAAAASMRPVGIR
jgi:hypothetical protein